MDTTHVDAEGHEVVSHRAAQYRRHFEGCSYRLGLLVLCCGITACDLGAYGGAPASRGKTMGFVMSDSDLLVRPADEACPGGFVRTNRDNWEVEYPTRTAQQEHLNRCGSYQNRGPNCENVTLYPELIEDPIPYRVVTGKIAGGVDLDGTEDGRATETTCAHESFISPEGEKGIDNQYYRFYGCWGGWYSGGEEIQKQVIFYNSPVNRLLLEIEGVENERNDDSVQVTMYRGRDRLIVDAAGKAVPWQSQRVDEGPRQVMFRVPGRIVDGVLTTEPTDVTWEDYHYHERRLHIRGMSLRLTLTDAGAEGLRVGYIDARQFWQQYSIQPGTIDGGISAPAAYRALFRLADGYKDPQTGTCTALSSARQYKFVRAQIIHPSKEINR